MGLVLQHTPVFAGESERSAFWQANAADTLFVSTHSPHALEPAAGRLSVRAAFGGRVTHVIGATRRHVDDDTYLVVNSATSCDTAARPDTTVTYCAVYFSEATVQRCLANFEGQLFQHSGPASASPGALFSERLRPHDRRVTPLLRALATRTDGATSDSTRALWEARAEELLLALLAERQQERERVGALAQARARTRQEIFRRVSDATDYLLSRYDEPITLQQLADVACLAKFHFLRMFVAVHDLTPMEYLRCKRVAAASRLLKAEQVSLSRVARQVGVADRSTLLRLFIDYRGTTPDQYRRGLRAGTLAGSEDSLLADLVQARRSAKGGRTLREPRAVVARRPLGAELAEAIHD